MAPKDTTVTEVSVAEVYSGGSDMTTEFVDTSLGRLHVSRTGTGPPVVLWHSLFLDSRSWCELPAHLADHRTVFGIDGPSHGGSEPVTRDFTFAECLRAAEEVLDGLGLRDPVDWVGNAWGGHVGIQLAAHRPERIRTLTTIGTPAHALRPGERWTKVWPLVQLYRLTGPNRLLLKPLADALVGPESIAAQPDLSAEVMSAFTSAHRRAMFHAMRSMMLRRPEMATDMAAVTAPTLIIAGLDDSTGWRPADARAVAADMRDVRVVAAAGSGHSSPLIVDLATVERALADFWDEVPIPYRP
jgi:pimeloyl-ACP methyl ester carboxylesterase